MSEDEILARVLTQPYSWEAQATFDKASPPSPKALICTSNQVLPSVLCKTCLPKLMQVSESSTVASSWCRAHDPYCLYNNYIILISATIFPLDTPSTAKMTREYSSVASFNTDSNGREDGISVLTMLLISCE